MIGFAATLYIARLLGAAPLGIYQLTISLVSWLAIVGKVGIAGAISKRVSEGDDRAEHAIAGTLLIGLVFVLVATLVILFRSRVDEYVGYPAATFVVLILFFTLAAGVVNSLLSGLHLVHVRGVLSPISVGSRSVFQILAVFSGVGIVGLFWGHLFGLALMVGVGLYVIARTLPRRVVPQRHHFRSLIKFAKFSWIGSLQSRMFNYTDIIVLGFFVSSSLIGIYAVAWNISQFLILFSGALNSTLFPEMSELSAQSDPQATADIIEQSLTYAGLFLIPGVFGGGILGERILRIYGAEFTQGAIVLMILIVANLFMGYQKQLLGALNAIDRPDLAFRVNSLFVVANLTLNVILVYLYSWTGAAIATMVSVAISLVVAYNYLSTIVSFRLPVGEIQKQGIAAVVMATVVYGGLSVEDTYHIVTHNFLTVLVLVCLGAGVYFAVLLVLSTRFRSTVRRNLPMLETHLPW